MAVGRKRKSGKRHPGGKLIQGLEPDRDPGVWLRMKTIIVEQARDPRLGSELGKLFFFDEIDSGQMDAGTKWQRLVVRYRFVIAAPSDVPRVKALGESIGLNMTDVSPEEAEEVIRRYDEASHLLRSIDRRSGQSVLKAVNDLVVRDDPPTSESKALAKIGLAALVVLWGLTGVKR